MWCAHRELCFRCADYSLWLRHALDQKNLIRVKLFSKKHGPSGHMTWVWKHKKRLWYSSRIEYDVRHSNTIVVYTVNSRWKIECVWPGCNPHLENLFLLDHLNFFAKHSSAHKYVCILTPTKTTLQEGRNIEGITKYAYWIEEETFRCACVRVKKMHCTIFIWNIWTIWNIVPNFHEILTIIYVHILC
jgi:hypothetical protein